MKGNTWGHPSAVQYALHAFHRLSSELCDIRLLQDDQLSQRDRAAGCVMVLAKSGRLELGDNMV